jgi:protein phosphatase
VAVALLVVLVAGAFGTYSWALAHWFVSSTGSGAHEDVAVFRGLDVSIIGFDLHKVDHDTGLAVGDLTPAARSRVRDGIEARNKADAERILIALRDKRLPLCSDTTTSTTATSTPATSPATTPAKTPGPTVPGPRTTAGAPRATGHPVTTTTPSASPTTSASTDTPVPGVDCREVK